MAKHAVLPNCDVKSVNGVKELGRYSKTLYCRTGLAGFAHLRTFAIVAKIAA